MIISYALSTILLLGMSLLAFIVGRGIEPKKTLDSAGAYVETLFYGLMIFGFCYAVLLKTNLWSPTLGWTLIIASAGLFYRNASFRGSFKVTAYWAVGVGIALLPFLVHAFWSARGVFSEYFFFVDNAWHLNLVQSLLRYEIYPPISLGDHAFQVHYHNLHALLAALFSSLTGVTPHFGLFGLVFLFSMAYFLSATAKLLTVLGVRQGIMLAIVTVIVCGGMPENFFPPPRSWDFLSLTTFEFHVVLPLRDRVSEFLEDPFLGYQQIIEPPYMISATAILGFALSFDVVARTVRKDYLTSPIIFILLFAIFAVAKAILAVSVGIGVGLFSIFTFLRDKNRLDVAIPVAAGIAMTASFFWIGPGNTFLSPPLLSGHVIDRGGIGWSFGTPSPLLFSQSRMLLYWWTLATYCTLAMILRFAEVRTRPSGLATPMMNPIDLAMMFFVLPFLLVFFANFEIPGFVQFITPAAYLAFTLVMVMLARIGERGGRPYWRILAIAPVIFLLILNTIPSIYYSLRTALEPEYGVASVSNRSLAEVLEVVPIGDSVLVTNDIHFPAVNPEKRALGNAYPMAAVFGHKGFNLDKYGPINPFYWAKSASKKLIPTELIQDQLDLQKLLTADVWPSKQIKDLHRKYGLTHLVIRKNYPHAIDIPLKKLRENSEYAIYEF
jgi:hypothetical protein